MPLVGFDGDGGRSTSEELRRTIAEATRQLRLLEGGKTPITVALPGDRYGRWTVLSEGPRDNTGRRRVFCRCECGKEQLIWPSSFHRSRGCRGCAQLQKSSSQLEKVQPGDAFGRWTVLREGPRVGRWRKVWCRCTCGEERLVYVNTLGRSSKGCRRCAAQNRKPRPCKPGAIDDRYGRWTVLREVEQRADLSGSRQVLCRCDCGTERVVILNTLRRASSTQCRECAARARWACDGDLRAARPRAPVVAGAMFGRWTVLREGLPDKKGHRRVFCRCSCGKEKLVFVANLYARESTGCRRCANANRSIGPWDRVRAARTSRARTPVLIDARAQALAASVAALCTCGAVSPAPHAPLCPRFKVARGQA